MKSDPSSIRHKMPHNILQHSLSWKKVPEVGILIGQFLKTQWRKS